MTSHKYALAKQKNINYMKIVSIFQWNQQVINNYDINIGILSSLQKHQYLQIYTMARKQQETKAKAKHVKGKDFLLTFSAKTSKNIPKTADGWLYKVKKNHA